MKWLAAALLLLTAPAHAGDAERGRALVLDRATTACLLCHPGPFGARTLQGNLAPDLTGVGTRLTPAELRARLTDPARFNPDTIMPAYGPTTGLTRVGAAWHDRPILTSAQIDDVAAFLSTLTSP